MEIQTKGTVNPGITRFERPARSGLRTVHRLPLITMNQSCTRTGDITEGGWLRRARQTRASAAGPPIHTSAPIYSSQVFSILQRVGLVLSISVRRSEFGRLPSRSSSGF